MRIDGLTVHDLLHKYANDPNAGGKAAVLEEMLLLELLIDSEHIRDQTI